VADPSACLRCDSATAAPLVGNGWFRRLFRSAAPANLYL